MKANLCAVTEHWFCLYVSDKLGRRETTISIVLIIESRASSSSSKEASFFLALKGNYLQLFVPVTAARVRSVA